METFRGDRPHPAPLVARGEDPPLYSRFRPRAGPRIEGGRGAQRLCPQTRLEGDGGPQGRDPASPPRHGSAEEQRQGVRFHQGPHRRLHRRRLGDGRRHDAGRRQRYRRGGDPRGAGGPDAEARAAGGPVHGHRGDRHGRCERSGKGAAARRHPAEPRFRGGGRTLRGLRRRARRQYDLRLQGRADARGRLYRCEDQRQGAQGRPLGHPDRLPARQRQQGAVPLFECRAVRRAAGVGGRRRTPQRHPARGRGRGAGRNRGLRRVRRRGESLRGDRKGRVRRHRGLGVGQGRGGRETG